MSFHFLLLFREVLGSGGLRSGPSGPGGFSRLGGEEALAVFAEESRWGREVSPQGCVPPGQGVHRRAGARARNGGSSAGCGGGGPAPALLEAWPRGDSGWGGDPHPEACAPVPSWPNPGPRERARGDWGGLRGPGERWPELTPNPEVAPGGHLGSMRAGQFPKTFRLETRDGIKGALSKPA